MTPPRLLILTPTFHDYWAALAAAFSSLGYEVTTHRYDALETVAAKARHKLGIELPSRIRVPRADRAPDPRAVPTRTSLDAIRATRPQRVLVVKGDLLGPAVWDELEAHGIPSVLWLYDELRRTRWERAALHRPGAVASYSSLDVATLAAEGLPATHVRLGFDTFLSYAVRPSPEIAFVGARYPNRERLLGALVAADVPVRAFGREWSSHLIDRLRTWRIRAVEIPAGRDLDRATAYGILAGAPAAVNIHGDQDGFTMRTFEVGGVGGVQFVDRADVSEVYDVGTEVAVFESAEELVDLARRAQRDERWTAGLRLAGRARTLAEHTLVHRARALESLWV